MQPYDTHVHPSLLMTQLSSDLTGIPAALAGIPSSLVSRQRKYRASQIFLTTGLINATVTGDRRNLRLLSTRSKSVG